MQNISVFISHHLLLVYSFAIVLLIFTFIEFLRAKRNRVAINPQQAVQLINRQNAAVFDIRSKDNYESGHITDALSLPTKELLNGSKMLEKYKKRPVIIVCNAGTDSQKVAATLFHKGYNAFSLAGGMRAWLQAELPLIKKEKS